jgi:hypothetical protein
MLTTLFPRHVWFLFFEFLETALGFCYVVVTAGVGSAAATTATIATTTTLS